MEAVITLTYNQLVAELQKGTLLIDVRTPAELAADGKIEQAKHIPLSELMEALQLGEEEFKAKYGFDKPKSEDQIIVHCNEGKRAQTGAQTVTELGFKEIKVYPGIVDWKNNGGSVVSHPGNPTEVEEVAATN